jgi:hypothetical protein
MHTVKNSCIIQYGENCFLELQKSHESLRFSSYVGVATDSVEANDCVDAGGNSISSKPPRYLFLLKYGENCLPELPKTHETLPF